MRLQLRPEMKLIQDLSDRIEEENNDAEFYAEWALEVMDMYPQLANTLFKISLEETRHMNALHDEVVKIINQYRADHGDPPADMLAIYEYLHKKHIAAAGETKALQIMFQDKVSP